VAKSWLIPMPGALTRAYGRMLLEVKPSCRTESGLSRSQSRSQAQGAPRAHRCYLQRREDNRRTGLPHQGGTVYGSSSASQSAPWTLMALKPPTRVIVPTVKLTASPGILLFR